MKNLAQAPWTSYRIIGGKAVILNNRSGEIFILNFTAGKIWDFLNKKRSPEEIIKKFSNKFDMEEERFAPNIRDFIRQLIEQDLLAGERIKTNLQPRRGAALSKGEVFKYIIKKAENKKIPFFGHLELTHNCNLQCKHCYLAREKRNEISTARIITLIDELADMNCFELTLSGGEPLTRPDFFKILRHARKKKFSAVIKTNGTLIGEKSAKLIAGSFPFEVHISIYSLKDALHDFITGVKGSLKNALRGIELLRKNGVKVKISSPITNLTYRGYEDIKKYAKSMGARSQADPIILARNNGSIEPLKYRMNESELKEFFSYPASLKEAEESAGSFSGYMETSFEENENLCRAGHCLFAVNCYGDVLPCSGFRLKAGSILKNSFFEIWNSSPELLYLRSLRKKDLKFCSDCSVKKSCYLCPGMSYLEKKDILGKSDFVCLKTKSVVSALSGRYVSVKF